MKRYIRSDTSFSTVNDILPAVNRVFEGYIKKVNYLSATHQYEAIIDPMFGKGLSIRIGVCNRSDEPRGSLCPASSADGNPCLFLIADNPDNAPLLDAFYANRFPEACNFRNSQWGTYKIVIYTYDDLVLAKEIFEKFVMNELPYTGR